MSAIERVPIEEYLHTVYEPDAEYVDGVIEERVGFEYDHSSWQAALLAWFYPNEKLWNVRALLSLRIRVSKTRIRVPDVVVMDRSHPIEQIPTIPPLAALEILSPEDKITRVLTKLAEYEKMGVRTIVVIDPATRQFHRYDHGSLQLLEGGTVQIAGSSAELNWREIEALLD